MDAMEALLTRRAVREFTAEPVTEEQIQQILCAAMHAPSACNQQPWHFVVVTDPEQRKAIAAIHPYAQMVLQAPVVFIICADLSLETCPGNWVIDCSAATENLLLAAHAIGLSGVWVGIHPVEERVNDFKKLLGLPAYAMPLCLTPIGHAAGPLPKADRFQPARIHQDRW